MIIIRVPTGAAPADLLKKMMDSQRNHEVEKLGSTSPPMYAVSVIANSEVCTKTAIKIVKLAFQLDITPDVMVADAKIRLGLYTRDVAQTRVRRAEALVAANMSCVCGSHLDFEITTEE